MCMCAETGCIYIVKDMYIYIYISIYIYTQDLFSSTRLSIFSLYIYMQITQIGIYTCLRSATHTYMYHDAWFSCQITFCLCLVKTPTVCTGTRVPTTCKWMRRRKLMVWHYQRSYRTETMGISGGLYTCGFCVLHVSQCSAYGRVVSAHRVRMPSQTIG